MLNRSALIVRPNEPCLAWMRSVNTWGIDTNPYGEQTVYLIPTLFGDLEEAVQAVYCTVFEDVLSGWHPDEEVWPRDRSFAVFKEWFKIELHSRIDDLCCSPIVDEDPGED